MYYISTNFRNFILHTLHQRGVSWVLEYVPIKIFMIQNASISMFLLLLGTSYEKYRILSFLQKCKPLQNTSSKKFRNNPPESSQCPVDTRGIVYKPHFCTLIIYPPPSAPQYTHTRNIKVNPAFIESNTPFVYWLVMKHSAWEQYMHLKRSNLLQQSFRTCHEVTLGLMPSCIQTPYIRIAASTSHNLQTQTRY
jgi:hypothetical protein